MNMNNSRWKVCIIGLGTVGMPTAKYIASRKIEVYGYDIVNKKNDRFPITTNWEEIPHERINVYLITVWLGIKNGKPDLTALEDIAKKISVTNPDALIAIESTIPVGTSRKISKKYGLEKIVHVPHRYWIEDPVNHGVRHLRVFGALNKESKKIGLEFYRDLDIPLYIVEPIEVVEMSKIAENAYRFVQIAFAEELKTICDQLGIDFNKVRETCNTKWNVEILEAREGIGGTCLPKDIRFLLYLAKKAPILEAAIKSDEIYLKKRCN